MRRLAMAVEMRVFSSSLFFVSACAPSALPQMFRFKVRMHLAGRS